MLNVAVLFRNNKEFVAPFFFFLRKSTGMDLKVFALDNGSEDGTGEEVRKHMSLHDVLIESEDNKGIAGGRKLVIEEMKKVVGSYSDILLLDSDVFIIKRDSINRLCDAFAGNKSCGIAMGSVLSFNLEGEGVASKRHGICFCLIRKEVFDTCGVFDPQFRMFYDDTDFMHRMKLADFIGAVRKDAECVHMWGSTTFVGSEGGEIRKKALENDRKRFMAKWNIEIPEIK